MTEKLYDQDAYLKQFQAVVMEARPAKSGYEIRLDRTAFYPEGGGQQGDTGFLRQKITDRQIPVPDYLKQKKITAR